MTEALEAPGWLSPNLAEAVEVTPVPAAPFWRVRVEYTWRDRIDGEVGSGSTAFPAMYSVESALASLARLQADPATLGSLIHPERVYTATRWQVLRYEQWAFLFAEEVPNDPPEG